MVAAARVDTLLRDALLEALGQAAVLLAQRRAASVLHACPRLVLAHVLVHILRGRGLRCMLADGMRQQRRESEGRTYCRYAERHDGRSEKGGDD